MNSYTFSITLTVLANVGYHLCQKSIHQGVSPLISLIATYAVALLTALIAAPFFGTSLAWSSFRELNWASYGLGELRAGRATGWASPFCCWSWGFFLRIEPDGTYRRRLWHPM